METCAALGGLVNWISKLLEFLVDFSPFLGGLLMSRGSKLLEFLWGFSHCLLVGAVALLLTGWAVGVVGLNPGFMELVLFSICVVLIVYIVISLLFLQILVLNLYFTFRSLVITISFLHTAVFT